MRHTQQSVLVLCLLLACFATAQAQVMRGNLGGGGPTLGGPIGGGLGTPGNGPGSSLNNGLTMPDLRGSLPIVETPKLNLPAGQLPPSGNAGSNQRHTDTSDSTRFSSPAPGRQADMNVNRPIREARGVNLDPHDPPESKQKEKDDDEGGSKWWVWLIVVAVVYLVATRKQ